jgi:hypothetical protein
MQLFGRWELGELAANAIRGGTTRDETRARGGHTTRLRERGRREEGAEARRTRSAQERACVV